MRLRKLKENSPDTLLLWGVVIMAQQSLSRGYANIGEAINALFLPVYKGTCQTMQKEFNKMFLA